jgi:hypothetical protein
MASCGGPSCTKFDGTGNVWFKIDEMGLVSGETDTGVWASTLLIQNNLSWTVTVPQQLRPGAYLIRHEILALHSAGAPQFYPSCTQLIVAGSGVAFPSDSELVAIPGIYSNDTSTMINIWANGQTSYPIAGPSVTSLMGSGYTSNAANSQPGGIGPLPFVLGTVIDPDNGTTSPDAGSGVAPFGTGSSSSTATLTATADGASTAGSTTTGSAAPQLTGAAVVGTVITTQSQAGCQARKKRSIPRKNTAHLALPAKRLTKRHIASRRRLTWSA